MQSKSLMIVLGVVIGVLLSAGVVLAGNLNPTGAPTTANSQVFTLAQIYSRLENGAPATKATTFMEPVAGPATPSMYSLDQIMAIAPELDDSHGARAGQVVAGKNYWGLRSDGWGTTTGAMPVVAGPTLIPTTTTQSVIEGIYESDITIAGDADLLAANISQGYTLLGVEGAYAGGEFYTSGLPTTGQATTCFTADADGSPMIACPANAQRGAPLPTPRFIVGDQAVTDLLTGLMWTKDGSLGPNCSGADMAISSWNDALASVALCNTNNYAGYNDWRLPNAREALSLINYEYVNPINKPALSNAAGTGIWSNGDPFTLPNPLPTELNYWTSTTFAADEDQAWMMISYVGNLYAADKISLFTATDAHVWAVRGGQ
jgi:hypothetical protein